MPVSRPGLGSLSDHGPRQRDTPLSDSLCGLTIVAKESHGPSGVAKTNTDSNVQPNNPMSPSEVVPTMDSDPLILCWPSLDDFVDDCYGRIRRFNSLEVTQNTLVDLIFCMDSNQIWQRWSADSLIASGQHQ